MHRINTRLFILLFAFTTLTNGICQQNVVQESSTEENCVPEYRFDGEKLLLTEKEWKERLTPEQFKILRKSGTERAFHNVY